MMRVRLKREMDSREREPPFFNAPVEMSGMWPATMPSFRFQVQPAPGTKQISLQFTIQDFNPPTVEPEMVVLLDFAPKVKGGVNPVTFVEDDTQTISFSVGDVDTNTEVTIAVARGSSIRFSMLSMNVTKGSTSCPTGTASPGTQRGYACCPTSANMPCDGHGICRKDVPSPTASPNLPPPGTCKCNASWSGDPSCSKHSDMPLAPSSATVAPSPSSIFPPTCHKNSTCSNMDKPHPAGYCIAGECKCYVPWGGQQCENCKCEHGTCSWASNKWACGCDEDWQGALCTVKKAETHWSYFALIVFCVLLVPVLFFAYRRGRRGRESQRESQRLLADDDEDSVMPHYIIPPESLVLREEIGGGASGLVRRAIFQGVDVAAKEFYEMLDLVVEEENARENVFREARTLMTLHHPNVVQFFGICIKDSRCMYLVMELGIGTMADAIEEAACRYESHGGGEEKEKDITAFRPPHFIKWARGVAAAVAYLHSMGMLHRDLKPANVLLCSGDPPVIKLCDFGISKTTKARDTRPGSAETTASRKKNLSQDSNMHSRMSFSSNLGMDGRAGDPPQVRASIDSFDSHVELTDDRSTIKEFRGGSENMTLNVGTLGYMAPEVISEERSGRGAYGRGVDVWAFGVMMIALFTLRSPTCRRVGEIDPEVVMPTSKEKVPRGILRVIKGALRQNTSRRPTFQKIVRLLEQAEQ